MCGICGAVGFQDGQAMVRRMNRAMLHRGPDSEGFFDRGIAHLGIRRLKIIDLHTGDQPIYNEDRTIVLVFNGEIYNFRDLQRELQAFGHRFATRSDTEAIVHAYEEWGTDCPRHLRGMFAMAVLDCRPLEGKPSSVGRQRLFLARDRLGIKPLYVWGEGGRLLFASEVRALLASGTVPRSLSAAGIYTYLGFGSVQEPLTMFEGVTSLPPGSWVQYEIGQDELVATAGSYWQPPVSGGDEVEVEQLRERLAGAVQSHLVSDVPLGAFLSGGLDSGAIVALASASREQPLRTFTLGFDRWPDDESRLAGTTARRWNTDHRLRVITSGEVLEDLPCAIAAMDQPTVDGINTWYVSREARRDGLTVALSGVGGDELFAGYPSFRQVPALKRLPQPGRYFPFRHLWEDALAGLPGQADSSRKLGAILDGQTPFGHPYFAVRGLFTHGQIMKILNREASDILVPGHNGWDQWRETNLMQMNVAARYDDVGEVSWLELSQYMRSTLLRDTDMMSMAHSLEVRVPLLDHPLLESVLTIRGRRKLNRGQSKPLLVESIRGMLPPEVVRNPKQTFTLPFEFWMREHLSSEVGGRLRDTSELLMAWLKPAAVAGIWNDYIRGRTNWARPWALYVLDEWMRKNL